MAPEPRPLALVTGGTVRLGAAIAARLAGEGYDLALHYRTSAEPAGDLVKAIEASGVQHRLFQADLTEAEAAPQLFAAVASRFGRPPRLLVNSASRFGGDGLADTSQQALQQHYLVNAAAPALLCQQFAAHLPEEQTGAVVNLLDQRLKQPNADNFAYTLSKYALAGLTEVLARTLAPRIRVNAVAPGLTIPTQAYDKDRLRRVRDAMPLGALPSPAEVADAVAWLAAAEAVTGETIYVDAGARHRSFERDFDKL